MRVIHSFSMTASGWLDAWRVLVGSKFEAVLAIAAAMCARFAVLAAVAPEMSLISSLGFLFRGGDAPPVGLSPPLLSSSASPPPALERSKSAAGLMDDTLPPMTTRAQ